MRSHRTLPLKLLWAAYAVMWAGGVLRLPDPGWAAPAFLYNAAGIALLSDLRETKPLLAAAAIGFACEVLGVHTGIPFGSYEYTGKLGWSLFGVPLAITLRFRCIGLYGR